MAHVYIELSDDKDEWRHLGEEKRRDFLGWVMAETAKSPVEVVAFGINGLHMDHRAPYDFFACPGSPTQSRPQKTLASIAASDWYQPDQRDQACTEAI